MNFILTSLFSLTLLLSAGLIFWVEPLVAKMLLPYLGGAPAVWNTAMMFFQGTLLIGYFYAHFITRAPLKIQTLIHFCLLLLALIFLPFAVSHAWQPSDYHPVWALVKQLSLMVGLPLIILSANAPLLQRWFSLSNHPHAKDPYFLYSASNLGSMLALISFPLVFEPTFSLSKQTHLWQTTFSLFLIFVFLCIVALWAIYKKTIKPESIVIASADLRIPWTQKLRWILLAFAPSSLLLGVTTHLTTDVAAIPLFWVIPLALYLLTFIITFSRRPLLPHKFNLTWQLITVIPFFFLISLPFLTQNLWINFSINLLAFFFTALVCHGELVKSRPHTHKLTEFYLLIAFGGLLGGIFNAIIAPNVFTLVAEYPIAMAIALMLRPPMRKARKEKLVKPMDILLPIAAGIVVIILSLFFDFSTLRNISFTFAVIFAAISLLFFGFPERPIRFGLGLGILMLTAMYFLNPYQTHLVTIKRNFFGTIRVAHNEQDNVHILLHGTTMHGIQFMTPDKQKTISAYYVPLKQVVNVIENRFHPAKVAIAGLGSGTLACYARPEDQYTFYEIDPEMIKVAENMKYFTYLHICPAKGGIILGDARIELRKATPHAYNLIILDAFSSDAIPVHLITAEAVKLYLSKLSPHGLLAFNITNRNLNLTPVVTAIADHLHLSALLRIDKVYKLNEYKFGSKWVVFARNKQDLGALNNNPLWKPVAKTSSIRLWTDNYSDIWGVIK